MIMRYRVLLAVSLAAVLSFAVVLVALAAYQSPVLQPGVLEDDVVHVEEAEHGASDGHDHDHGSEDGQFPPPTMTKLADNVYHFFGVFSSSLVVIGEEGVLITDPSNPFRAQQLQEEISKLTDAPVTRILLTHEHYDHVGGTSLFPDARIACHRNCAPVFALATLGDVPAQVDEEFDTELTVSEAGIEVQMKYLGPGDGDATAVIYLPEEQIVVTSDLYEPRTLTSSQWVDDKNFLGVRRILNTVSEWPLKHAINAHSPGTDPVDLRENVAYYNDLFDAVFLPYVAAVSEGGPFAANSLLETLPQTVDLPQYQDWTNYDTAFPRHVQRMFQAISHGD